MHLIVINRENGKIEANIKDRKQYDIWRNYLLHTNDVQMGIKVFTEELGLTREQLLKDFSLVDIANILSTRYMIKNWEEIQRRGDDKI